MLLERTEMNSVGNAREREEEEEEEEILSGISRNTTGYLSPPTHTSHYTPVSPFSTPFWL